jgi:hypothetical protein
MDKCSNFYEFMQYVLDEEKLAKQGVAIIKGLLDAQSPRLTIIPASITEVHFPDRAVRHRSPWGHLP